ncbi:hypothetical protein A8924_2193 [Saccharopolyspora erythraea NRRL 2338]|nr:hypothetical protein A8924_2193 [Saccharopolyspora erythraea NRRL 2338]
MHGGRTPAAPAVPGAAGAGNPIASTAVARDDQRMRPAVGAALVRCDECGGHEYGGAPGCAHCAALVDGIVEEEWRWFRAD